MMPLEIASQLIEDLTREVSETTIHNLSETCLSVEAYLVGRLRSELLALVQRSAMSQGLAYGQIQDEVFLLGGELYVLRIVPDGIVPYRLKITINGGLATEFPSLSQLSSIVLETRGRVREIQIQVDERLAVLFDGASELCKTVFEVGYRWLEERVKNAIGVFRSDVAAAVYSKLRVLLSVDLANQIWLGVFIEVIGHYLLGPDQIRVALDRAGERRLHIPQSPLEAVTRFATAVFPFEKSLSRDAFVENRIIQRGIHAAPYAPTGIQLAEEQVYRIDRISIQPLVREGPTLLTAAYPIEIESNVAPSLETVKPVLKALLEERANDLHRCMAMLRASRVSSDLFPKLAEGAGAFIKGLLGL